MRRATAFLAVLVMCVTGICLGADGLIAPKPLGEIKDGREVQIKVREKYLGDDLAGRGTGFRLTDKNGNVRDRVMNRYVKDYRGSKKYLIRIVSPADIREVGLLTWENKGRDDTRFLYVPALKKTRRVATRDRGQRFIGSDFTYEDLGTVPVDDYTYSATTTVTLLGKECFYYECYAKPGSGARWPAAATPRVWRRVAGARSAAGPTGRAREARRLRSPRRRHRGFGRVEGVGGRGGAEGLGVPKGERRRTRIHQGFLPSRSEGGPGRDGHPGRRPLRDRGALG